MRYRALGNTGLTVSEVGFGGWGIDGKAFGPVDPGVALAALNRAYELGCTFFSTADSYGQSETLLGQALKGWKREEVVIASKGGQTAEGRAIFSEAYLRQAIEASLQRLGIDALDVYHLHNPSLELIQLGRPLQVLQALQQEGKIRHIGVTIHDPQEGIQAMQSGGAEVVEAVYNLFDRRAEKALFEACHTQACGLVIREPLARGFLSGTMTGDTRFPAGDIRAVWPSPLIGKRVQAADAYKVALPEAYPDLSALALKLALVDTAVSCVVPDFQTPAQVEHAMRVPELPELSAETRQQVENIAQRVF